MSASRLRRRWIAPLRPQLVAAAVGLMAVLAAGPGLGRASAAPLSSCTPDRGTVVAVDFAHWGGPIVRGCGVGQHTGYALLHAAGFTTAGDEHDGPAVVCRLGDTAFHHGTLYPTPARQACIQTPPTTGYWAYWVAPRGTDHWAYSPLGAMGDIPKPGEVELWIFGATNVAGTHGTGVPSFSPAALRARSPATTTSHTSTAHPSTSSTTASQSTSSTTTTQSTSTTTSTRETRTATTTTTTHTSTATATRPPRARPHRPPPPPPPHHPPRHPPPPPHHTAGANTTSTTRAGGAKVVSARPTSQRASAGSSTPLIIGIAIALLLCAGAARATWRRRREE